jgi:hypothetical protein
MRRRRGIIKHRLSRMLVDKKIPKIYGKIRTPDGAMEKLSPSEGLE